MSNQADAPTVDPDQVPETLCGGKINISVSTSGYATLTLTHLRAKAGPLVDAGQIQLENVVRARIVLPMDNVISLRDLLNNLLKDQPKAAAATAGPAKLN